MGRMVNGISEWLDLLRLFNKPILKLIDGEGETYNLKYCNILLELFYYQLI